MTVLYRSKIGIEIVALLIAGMLPGSITALADKNNHDPEVLWILGGVFILIMALMASTRYKVDGTTLRIYVLFFRYKPIDITTITEIKETNNPISAPAASIDRLGITHAKGYMLVSPKDKKGFIAALQHINPNIVFKAKN